MLYYKLSLKNYKRVRTKYATQLAEGLFDPNGFMEDMQPFFDDRERKYLAYTSEKNEIDDRQKPNTKIIKVNNKLHAGMYNIVVDQAVNHFTGIPIKWDYDVSEQKRTIIQRMKDRFLGNDPNQSKTPEEFDMLSDMVDSMRFAMLDSESATYQGATGVAYRLLEPIKVGEEWELWASNIEPWLAERYQNGAVFIREKYDTMQRKFYQEMKVVTQETILTYDRYVDSSLTGVSGKFKLIDEVKNPLENIYLSEFKNNTNRYCDFEVAEEISDAIDRSLSDQQNEVEQFKLAYMMVTGSRLQEDEARRMMEQLGIINMSDPNSKVEYVTKDINKDFNEYHLDLLKRQFYTITKAIDFNDEVFKSNSSGEARKWQIIALEAKTNTKEQFFREGLKEVAETLAAFIHVKDKKEIDSKKIIFTFSRSLPTDIGYLAEALPKLAPYVSRRTIMNQVPFVEDVDYELQMMDIEQGRSYPDGEYNNLGGDANGKDTKVE
ncbi:SPP1 family phage portal protein [Enterococcus sp. 7E2_DIV0204]|uniref:phage portal protein n=1 Tax=unclassified Enterococcus TaxID=2608891 RepID=UPI000B692B8E|nr:MULTISPECIES: phage portal protein [unclassified Enterococcus]OTN86295.1 SPP1 family phage portal protein [Enterococcus sp. 7E2_DIV0204]OTP48512.1 SPP1 family phage portal protein [Enterococcus sp. 7D2_DIV0200]